MAWQKVRRVGPPSAASSQSPVQTPITSPLLNVRRELAKDAVKTFRVVQRIMGDRERDRPGGVSPATSVASSVSASSGMSLALLEEERWLLGVGLSHGELRDEIYCQVMKQLNGNPNTCVLSTRDCIRPIHLRDLSPAKVSSGVGNCSAYCLLRSRHQRTSKHTCDRTFSKRQPNKKVVWMSWRSTVCGGWRTFRRKALGANLQAPPRSKPLR